MLFNNLDRSGVNLQIDGNLTYFDVTNRRVGINTSSPAYALDLIGNAHLGNLYIQGNAITTDSGYKLNLGSISNIVITGGQVNQIVYTDGAGNLSFGTLDTLSGLEGFTGNYIALGANTIGSLGNAVSISTTTSVTNAIALLDQLLGNITNANGSVINTTTVNSTNLYGTVDTSSQPNITTLSNAISTGPLTVTGNTSISGNLFVTGNINIITGNITAINSAFFVGNTITGFAALYAGIPTGYSVLPNLVAQFSTNSNSYAQINAQNINSGQQATTDYIATANNGTDTTYYVDLGIASNTYNPAIEFNSLGTSLYANDAYLYSQGNVSYANQIGGNLVIGAITGGKNIKFIAGGSNSANVVVTMNSPTTISSNATTGALVVTGDTGISGNVNAGGTISATGNILGANIIGSSMYAGNISSTFYGNIHADVITPYQTTVTTFNSSTAVGLPIGGNVARPSSPLAGQIRYNSDYNSVEFYNGTGWVNIINNIAGQNFYGDGTNVTYTLNQTTTANGILVSINGTVQQPGYAYSVTGNQITFTQIPLITDQIDIRYLAAAVTIDNVFNTDVSVTGNITLTGILSSPLTTKASNAPGTAGQVCWDANYIYVCTATNTWKKTPLTGGY